LADGDIDTKDVEALLIDNGIDGIGGLAGLPVADDQLTLSAADGDHGVDGLDARLQGFAHRLACIQPRRHNFNPRRELRFDRALAIDGLADCVDYTPDERFSHRNLCNASRALDRIAFLHPDVITHEHGTDIVFFKI